MPQFQQNKWKTLDKDLSRLVVLEQATVFLSRPLIAVGIGLAFIALCAIAAAILTGGAPNSVIIITAAAFGAYMALNIGANDVANNMGPAVGANALTMGGALIIAAVFETAGALIAGGDVVSTISGGIVAPEAVADPQTFIWAMMAALIAASLWLNLATWFGAPVSTTHAIVGGVMGAGVVAAGFGAVDWGKMGQIAASWVISPILGGVIAAGFLAFIKSRINDVEDKLGAARLWVPVLIGIMGGTFTTYLAVKGLKKLFSVSMPMALLLGLAVGIAAVVITRPLIRRKSAGMENRKNSLKVLFSMPLVISAALLSFAHGANDVANAVGPLAAIVHAVTDHATSDKVGIPLWVMLIGAAGISFGLTLFGPKLIRMVGTEITKLNPMRAYCVALSAAITVIVASWLGLPVSSTHIAVGAVFGVGFYREWHADRKARRTGIIKGKPVPPEERSRRKLVRRVHILSIGAAWVVTVPLTALLSALIFVMLRLLT
ncbi:PiT family inorganic phosphate transporter [Gemmobacter caeni]|uniref:Phosphate transporter n=2 Tax=Gemmobacter TaxID=204456 RepID=A0A2T6B309_9RHOB|nr:MULTISPECIES: inorganic phosphate transporter [Gemmobacter]PTX50415.1 PiT family inorganic phosphate transporter [Gemmobacter caeni]TWI98368.1 PiT family inorganic phosphate transporter [Gemmobacter caeni]GHC27367.1 phosphate transporter [Gemmobacter nanjingensis]